MKLQNIDVDETLQKAREALNSEKNISSTTKLVFELLITLIVILTNRLGLYSTNSSKPPSTDNKKKKKPKNKSGKNKGGQNGRNGTTLDPVASPDEIQVIKIDRRTLPRGGSYVSDGYVSRQVFTIKIARFVTEYRAEKLIDQRGTLFVCLMW
jgi:transposase